MKKTLPCILIILCASAGATWIYAAAQDQTQPTTIILVRHAEKSDDGTDNPHLTLKGTQRAEDLAYILDHVKLAAIYSTPFHRTRETGEPTARRQAKKIRLYQTDDQNFLDRLLEEQRGGNILIVGHSNTVPVLVNQLTGSEDFAWLHDSVYDNLYIVTVREKGQAKVLRLRFGATTPEK